MERERLRQAWTGPDLRQNTSHQLATLCSTLSEVTMETKPSLSVEVLCETVEQVWAVRRQDRHKLSQAQPISAAT